LENKIKQKRDKRKRETYLCTRPASHYSRPSPTVVSLTCPAPVSPPPWPRAPPPLAARHRDGAGGAGDKGNPPSAPPGRPRLSLPLSSALAPLLPPARARPPLPSCRGRGQRPPRAARRSPGAPPLTPSSFTTLGPSRGPPQRPLALVPYRRPLHLLRPSPTSSAAPKPSTALRVPHGEPPLLSPLLLLHPAPVAADATSPELAAPVDTAVVLGLPSHCRLPRWMRASLTQP
jgi:hypothetical protein